MAASQMPKKLGAYEVGRRLGRGGMGEVFLATHTLLGRPVAIKRFAPERSRSGPEEMAERFVREGKALAELSHQHIVGIHDLIANEDAMYMVLDYVDGADVASLLDEGGAFAVEVAAIVALKTAEALQCAHYNRIIHRDIKGGNVMISRSGEIKLMDFGVALDERLDAMTETGLVVGTPMYVAPEVISGEPATERSDLYALGVLLYAMLSGKRPFEHARNQEHMFQLILAGRSRSLTRVARHVPRALRLIVERLLHRKADRRFSSAAEVRQALEIFLASQQVWANHEARLVAFMRERGHLTAAEADSWLEDDESELFSIPSQTQAPQRPTLWLGLAVGATLTVLGLAWFMGS
ncbi:MAG: serine/threonine-protein kinase [Myxococcota bacterium]